MIGVDTSARVPIKMWVDGLSEEELAQARNCANLPFVFRHVALMPDAHLGMGCTIGTVLPTIDVVIPNCVGVDISCGMAFLPTNIRVKEITQATIKSIMRQIRETVPFGLNGKHKNPQPRELMPPISLGFVSIVEREYDNARRSLGTVGSGNHFLEFQQNSAGLLCVMVHCGSRNLGKQVADHYNKIAVTLNKRYYSEVLENLKLAFLPVGTKECEDYLAEMNYCMAFAKANRQLIIKRVQEAILEFFPNADFTDYLDVHHNFVRHENHFGKNVWVHRKGSTSARLGELGVIPGSMGTSSFIVRGKGNPESFMSCSHGSGRTMSRKAAIRDLSLDVEIAKLDSVGVIHGVRGPKDLDECPSSYKDIKRVMQNQDDLVEIVDELFPIASMKG